MEHIWEVWVWSLGSPVSFLHGTVGAGLLRERDVFLWVIIKGNLSLIQDKLLLFKQDASYLQINL